MNKSPIRNANRPTSPTNPIKKRSKQKSNKSITTELKPLSNSDSENTLPNTPPKPTPKRDTRKRSPRHNDNKSHKLKPHPKRVSFKPNFLQVIQVESYKQYNSENTCDDPSYNVNNRGSNRNGKVHCKCSIF